MCTHLVADKSSNTKTPPSERDAILDEIIAQHKTIRPSISAKNSFFAEGSYLLWRAYEEGMSYALRSGFFNISIDSLTDSLAGASIKGEVHDPKFDWNSGFRVGIGYRMPHDAWELSLVWTRLHSKAHGPLQSAATLGLEATVQDVDQNYLMSGPVLFLPSAFSSLSSALQIHLNVIDGELARFFQATPFLSFKPHMGVRGLLVSQSYTVALQGLSSLLTNLESSTFSGVSEQGSRCRGVGLRAGVETEWEFCKDWGLYGNIGGSLLCATFNLHQMELYEQVNGSAFDLSVTQQEKLRATILPTVDLSLGLFWEHSFNKTVVLGLRAGWEFNDFLNQNKMLSSANGAFNSLLGYLGPGINTWSHDLTYQGFTFKIRLDF